MLRQGVNTLDCGPRAYQVHDAGLFNFGAPRYFSGRCIQVSLARLIIGIHAPLSALVGSTATGVAGCMQSNNRCAGTGGHVRWARIR